MTRVVLTAQLSLLLLGSAAWSADKPAGEAAVVSVETLSAYPSSLTLSGIRDSRRLIVTGTDSAGRSFDVSSLVTLAPGSDLVTIDADGFIVPQKVGRTTVKVTVGKKSVDVPVEVKDVTDHPVSFVREVIPVISKVGCNAGTCHGAQKGKGGFTHPLARKRGG